MPSQSISHHRHLQRTYGITRGDYQERADAQDNRCAICRETRSLLDVDHDHASGRVRGLLCNSCNRGLGFFKDNPAWLREAAAYVERNMSHFKPIPGVFFIGVGAKARSGKDTAAAAMRQKMPSQVRIFAFADALKAYCRVARGMTTKDPAMLQQVATEEFRAKDPEVWIRALYWRVDEERPLVAIIPDVRFENEAEFVKQMGGVLVRVSRLTQDSQLVVATDRNAEHISETGLDNYSGWDYELTNVEGKPWQLEADAQQLFEFIMAKQFNGLANYQVMAA